MTNVAEALGVPVAILRGRLKDNPDINTKPLRTMDTKATEIATRAHQAANLAAAELAGPDLPTVAQAAERTAVTVAVDVTSKVLERHRREWEVPRGLLGEAVKARDFEKAKLAKITAETLSLVQSGERIAHGIKSGDIPQAIEIERE